MACREQQAYEKKIRKAKAKSNADLAQRLATRRPTYTLDRLVKERHEAPTSSALPGLVRRVIYETNPCSPAGIRPSWMPCAI